MTGPEHYREAERHLSAASHLDRPGGKPADPSAAAHQLATAQVHATLALAAATAAQDSAAGMTSADHKAWTEAAITPESDYDVSESIG